MHERGKAGEGVLFECQTCEKKIYVVKKILGKIFLKFFSWNLILIYILNYFYHFQPFSYYKKCAYLKEVIRRDSDQCVGAVLELNVAFFRKYDAFFKFPKKCTDKNQNYPEQEILTKTLPFYWE